MPSFHGGMREQADHGRPWVRLRIDRQAARLGPWLPLTRRSIPTYVMPWSAIERVEAVTDRYMSGPAVRFVLRAPVAALEGPPNAAQWPAARQPVFLCGSMRSMRRVLAAVPGNLTGSPTGTPTGSPGTA